MVKKDQLASFEFLKWQDLYEEEKPFEIFIEIPDEIGDRRRTNLEFQKVDDLLIEDIRGRESEFTLDKHAFQVVEAPTKFTDFKNRVAVDRDYAAECEQLLRDHVEGVDRVHFFNWRLRASEEGLPKKVIDLNDPTDELVPAVYPHIDESQRSAILRVRSYLKDEADELLKGRFRIINIWRPLRRVDDWPLAMTDGRTVKESDLVKSDNVRKNFVGENIFAMFSPDFKWYYLSDQEKDEATLLKIYDSKPGVEAISTLHGAFKLSDPSPDALARESIEIRALVFTNPE